MRSWMEGYVYNSRSQEIGLGLEVLILTVVTPQVSHGTLRIEILRFALGIMACSFVLYGELTRLLRED